MLLVSVVIPTYNRAADLRSCLTALTAQTLGRDAFEVLVVDDGSTDDTRQMLGDLQHQLPLNLRWFSQHNQGPATARNRGIRESQADLVAFTDDDCLPEPDWLQRLVERMQREPALAGCGGQTLRFRERLVGRFIDELGMLNPGEFNGEVRYLVTANVIFRREVLAEVEGFDERFTWPGGEDPDLSCRIRQRGYRLGKEPQALLRHRHRDSLAGLYRTAKIYGKGEAASAHFEGKSPYRLGVWEFASCLVSSQTFLIRRHLPLGDRLGFTACQLLFLAGLKAGRRTFQIHNSVKQDRVPESQEQAGS